MPLIWYRIELEKGLIDILLETNKIRKLMAVMAISLLMALFTPGTPAGQAASKTDAQNVQSDINNLNVALAEAVDRYDVQAAKLDELNAQIDKNQAEMDNTAKDLIHAMTILNNRAIGIYKRGDVSSLEVIFNSKNLADFIQQLDLLTRIGDKDAEIVEQVETQKKLIEVKAKELNNQHKEQEALTNDLAAQRDAIDAQLSDKENVLASILQDIANMDAAEAERAATRARQRGSRRSGATLTCPLPGGGWGAIPPGYESDHNKDGGGGHGVWLWEYSNEGIADAIDVGGTGDIVYAAHSGYVIYSIWDGGYGGVTIISGDGFITCYAHSRPIFGEGAYVNEGQSIAQVSGVGHLHFELLDGGSYVPAGDFQTYF